MRTHFLRLADLIGGLALLLFVCGQLGADEPTPVAAPAEAVQAAEPAKPVEPAEKARPAEPALPAKPAGLSIGEWMSRPPLGIALTAVPSALDEQLQLNGEGVLVAAVVANSAAAKVGLKAHDILLRVNDTTVVLKPGELPKVRALLKNKDLKLSLLRAGKPLTVAVTSEFTEEGGSKTVTQGDTLTINTKVPFSEEIEVELHNFEERIREKLHDAGIDVRIQLVKPGKFMPKDVVFSVNTQLLPNDLHLIFRKRGNESGEIEVKRGDQSWKVRENELEKLPMDVRVPVEVMLRRGPMVLRGQSPFGHPAMTDHSSRPPYFQGPRNQFAVPKQTEDAKALAAGLQKQVEEMSRNLNKMQDDMKILREKLQERTGTNLIAD